MQAPRYYSDVKSSHFLQSIFYTYCIGTKNSTAELQLQSYFVTHIIRPADTLSETNISTGIGNLR